MTKDTIVCIAGRHYKLTPKALRFMDELYQITGVSKDDPQAREKITAILLKVKEREDQA